MRDPAAILRGYYRRACPGEFFLRTPDAAEINSRNFLVRLDSPEARPAFVLKVEVVESEALRARRWQQAALLQRHAESEPLLPKLVPTDDGHPCGSADGEMFRLLKYCAGHAFPGGPTALAEAARGLARLHLGLRGEAAGQPASELYAPLNQAEQNAATVRLRAESPRSAFASRALAMMRGELPRAYAEISQLELLSVLPRGLVHHDFHPGNALFNGDRLVAILDLESLVNEWRGQAVAFAASRFAGLDSAGSLWRFLAAYHAVDPLLPAEARHCPHFIRREAVRRINWILRANVLAGQDRWRGELNKHTAALHAARRLDDAFALPDDAVLTRLAG